MDSSWDLVIVGGGPAGLAAAAIAGKLGLRALLVDEQEQPGGQIYKQSGPGCHEVGHESRERRAAQALFAEVAASGVALLQETSVIDIRDRNLVVVPRGRPAQTVVADRVIIAPGAHDRPVPFPGWTLPGVITAGGAQTLVKTQRVVPGERIVFAGSGPLALAFPSQLSGYGANVVLGLEAGRAPGPVDILRLLIAAPGNLHLLRDALEYRWGLISRRIPMRYRRVVVRALGTTHLEAVVHAKADRDWRPIPGTEETVRADTLCVGYGFIPSIELLRLAGCAFDYDENLGGPQVRLDAWQRTSVEGVLSGGDGAGVEGVFVARAQGALAAVAAALDLGRIGQQRADELAAPLRRQIARKRRFYKAMEGMFAVGPGIFTLADADTVVCRCESITQGTIDAAAATTIDVAVIKAETRAGMGMCQGRICQRHIAATIARTHDLAPEEISMATPRFPARPVPLRQVADESIESEKFFASDAS